MVSSGAEFVNSNQIDSNSDNNDSVSNLSNSNDDSESNLSKESCVTDSNVNCYGSVVVADGTTPGPSNIVDSEMTQVSDPESRQFRRSPLMTPLTNFHHLPLCLWLQNLRARPKRGPKRVPMLLVICQVALPLLLAWLLLRCRPGSNFTSQL